MKLITNHQVLVTAPSIENGIAQVEVFFINTLLVKYDKIDIDKEKCLRGDETAFQEVLDNSIKENRKTLAEFIKEFERTGISTVSNLNALKQGYPSKLLHIIAHFLDGFIGIDSVFYNLIEESHWVSDAMLQTIATNPENFQLIHLNGYSSSPDKVALERQSEVP